MLNQYHDIYILKTLADNIRFVGDMIEQGLYGFGESIDFPKIESSISDVLDVIQDAKTKHDSEKENT